MSNRTKRMDEKRAKFLASLEEGNSIARAASDAGVGRSTAYEWRTAEPAFAKAWDDAVESGTDALEDEAIKRAKNGSDTLLIFMLKGRRPEKFKERFSSDQRVTVQEKTFEQWLDEVHAENKQMFEEARQRVEQEMLEEARQSILAERKASGSA